MSKETDVPAFPIPLNPGENYKGHGVADGMTLRDYFAAKAMQGMRANNYWDDSNFERMAKAAYKQADAMLSEREK